VLPPVQRVFSFVHHVAALLVFTLHEALRYSLFLMCSEIEMNGIVKNALYPLNAEQQTFWDLRSICCAGKILRYHITETFVNIIITYLSGSRIIRPPITGIGLRVSQNTGLL